MQLLSPFSASSEEVVMEMEEDACCPDYLDATTLISGLIGELSSLKLVICLFLFFLLLLCFCPLGFFLGPVMSCWSQSFYPHVFLLVICSWPPTESWRTCSNAMQVQQAPCIEDLSPAPATSSHCCPNGWWVLRAFISIQSKDFTIICFFI